MGPLLMPRRQLLESPKMSNSDSTTSRSGRPFDELLSSNYASGSGDSSHPHSQPASPHSRSSTVHPVAVKPRDGTPPPPIPCAGSSARDQV
jgi:hypothetical protein